MAHRPRPKSSGRDLTKYNREHAAAAPKPKRKPASWQRTPQKDYDKWSKRVTELSKIENPNDWQKNQLSHAKTQAASSKSKLKIVKPTAKDNSDATKEAGLTKLLKNKPKGGYSKENTKDPGPGLGKDNKPRTATLEEDRKANAPKPKPKPEKKTEKTTEKNKDKLQVKVDPKIGDELPKTFDKPKKEAKKPAKKMSKLEKQNRARHGDAAIDHLKSKNKDFQSMKKGKMKKADFIKKYPKSITAQKAAGLRRR